MTPEELQEIERAHENAIWRHNREARPWATMRRAARLTAALTAMRGERDCLFVLAEHIQTDLEAVTRANARAEGHAAGLASGLERGHRDAQTEIDGLTYERGRDDERARIEGHTNARLRRVSVADDARGELSYLLTSIRSGEPAPEAP